MSLCSNTDDISFNFAFFYPEKNGYESFLRLKNTNNVLIVVKGVKGNDATTSRIRNEVKNKKEKTGTHN